MADYRLSATAISRGKGQSSVASAAYRSGAKLVDDRTGEIHDYTRKAGVIHSEVMTPEATPEWMQDRAQLWNAVEIIETRKNSQLAREIQLSLPHELEPEQRTALVREFVQEQFVNQGMIADVNIHLPDKNGDERNHHAHIMLTMRELTGEGFHSKKATPTARSWNSDEMLLQWREEWANHQNRALERNGHKARVDHRSFEAQGIDREPQQHLGSVASDMERNGKASRIGDENREIANDNSERVHQHLEAVTLAMQNKKSVLDLVADIDRNEIENAQKLADLDLSQKHHRQKLRLEDNLEKIYGTAKATIKAEVNAINQRLEAKGVRKILRNVFGKTRSDRSTRQEMTATLKGIEKRENEARSGLERRQKIERAKLARSQNKRRDEYVKAKQERREDGRGLKNRLNPRTKSPSKKLERKERLSANKMAATSSPSASKDFTTSKPKAKTPTTKPNLDNGHAAFNLKVPPPKTKRSDEPDLATQKTSTESKLDKEFKKAKKPWHRSKSDGETRGYHSSRDRSLSRSSNKGGDAPKGDKK